MAFADLTILTIVFEFIPPLIATLVYLLFFGKRRSKLIESFIVVMYLKTVTWFLYNIAMTGTGVSSGFDANVDFRTLLWLFLTDTFFQFITSLQEYLIWVMVAFFAVLFGMIVLAVKLTLQDPLKMAFKNLIKRVVGREPESDGYSGLRDRVEHITFEGVEPQPLNPEVQGRAWREAWRDYTIIGLATLIPTISVYVGELADYIALKTGGDYTPPDTYILNIIIFLTWIYRFGYPASNRIAKGAGLHLGDRDIGTEMMQGVLGWFFRLNILLTVGTIGLQVYQAITSGVEGVLEIVMLYYAQGLALATPPIIFVVLIFPLVEDFAVSLYKKVFEGITQAKRKTSAINWGIALRNTAAAVGTGLVIAGAFIGSVFAATLNYAIGHGQFLMYPGDVDDEFVAPIMWSPPDNYSIIGETVWVLLLLAVPFVMILLLGVVGHHIRKRLNANPESFALFSGGTLSVVTYYILPNLDYIVLPLLTPANIAGEIFNRLRPALILPTAEQQLYRLASQFIVNVPIYIFGALFVMYFFKFRDSWRTMIGEKAGPLLNVKKSDFIDSAILFFGGLVVSVAGVWIVSQMFIDPFYFRDLLVLLLTKIGAPDGLEGVLPPDTDFLARMNPGGWFVVFAEHNMVRTLLMLVAGPVFWSAALWFVAGKKTSKERAIGTWSVVVLVIGAAATFLWTQYDAMMNVFNPYDSRWGFSAQLGLRALVIFGGLTLVFGLLAYSNSRKGSGSGVWWFPLFISVYAAEYFVYDDQFSLLALIVLPLFLAGGYKLVYSGRPEVRQEDFIITYIKFGLMSIAIAEVLSTALTLGGIAIIDMSFGLNAWEFLARIVPHAIIEIPTFLAATALSIRVAKDLWPTVEAEQWDEVPAKTRLLLGDERTWRTYILIVLFLCIAALIEAFVTPIIFWMTLAP
ncbi:MAG: hypothetical protein DRP09_07070 [Candidatus Thorarchaeota archaeon]|nr:MAG: hypothetical protein DRP09_07070 [Candidatus Thorarchaeota archaeon]